MATPEESPRRNERYQLWRDCTHDDTVMDPDTGETICLRCALTVPSEPVQIGGRLMPIEEYNRLLREKLVQLDAARKYCSRKLQKIGGVSCAWPGCEAAPMTRSPWCPNHRIQHRHELAKNRQAKFRNAVTHLPA